MVSGLWLEGLEPSSRALRELLGVDVCLPDECSWCHKGCSDPESLPGDSQGRPGLSPWAWLSNMEEDHCLHPCLSLGTWCLRPSRHLSHSSVAISVSLIMVPVCADGLILAHCDGKFSSGNWKEGMHPRDYYNVCTALTSSLSLNFHSRERT